MTPVPPRLLDPGPRRSLRIQATVLGSGLLAAWLASPDRPLPFEVCAFKILTGVPCPTCGLTRALCHALHGQWMESVRYHPAGILAAIVLIGWTAWSMLELVRGLPLGERARVQVSKWLVTTGAAISVFSWIVQLASGVWFTL